MKNNTPEREDGRMEQLLKEVAGYLEMPPEDGSGELSEEDLSLVMGGVAIPSYAEFLRKARGGRREN